MGFTALLSVECRVPANKGFFTYFVNQGFTVCTYFDSFSAVKANTAFDIALTKDSIDVMMSCPKFKAVVQGILD